MERLMPIEPGCAALVINRPESITVKVGNPMPRVFDAHSECGRMGTLYADGAGVVWEISEYITWRGDFGNYSRFKYCPESHLMRIDGHQPDQEDFIKREEVLNFLEIMRR